MPKFIDRTGLRVGRLTVLSVAEKRGGTYYWNCRCECGNTKQVSTGHLGMGSILSCGCLQKERASETQGTHRMSRTPVYVIWCAMKDRCANPANKQFHDYGGRGIAVCPEWAHDFERFVTDMGQPPDGASIDRINNDGDYSPQNCRWATRAEQSRNKRVNHMITALGRSQCLADWATELGTCPSTVLKRIRKRGWDQVRAVTTPVHRSATRRD